ncbi:serine/arginine repetitive matrix protein 1-like [Ischnura elegans]|uniref:serine/arginine repetitive matrix protein 1-like n=1 Tax=Ischnura elegans TaxID=197161 RepID=UPI001ED89A93|nr:serine/arginine repetitive matrix protein 1-like [Ischnura elegans]
MPYFARAPRRPRRSGRRRRAARARPGLSPRASRSDADVGAAGAVRNDKVRDEVEYKDSKENADDKFDSGERAPKWYDISKVGNAKISSLHTSRPRPWQTLPQQPQQRPRRPSRPAPQPSSPCPPPPQHPRRPARAPPPRRPAQSPRIHRPPRWSTTPSRASRNAAAPPSRPSRSTSPPPTRSTPRRSPPSSRSTSSPPSPPAHSYRPRARERRGPSADHQPRYCEQDISLNTSLKIYTPNPTKSRSLCSRCPFPMASTVGHSTDGDVCQLEKPPRRKFSEHVTFLNDDFIP